jgi:DNA-binding NarL/FixJ family response regulator
MRPYRILIADDHEIVRRGLRVLLQGYEGWEVCGEANDGYEAVSRTVELKPDLAIVDLRMPRLSGLDATRKILELEPATAVLILTIDESEHAFREALKAGARGFLNKSEAGRSLRAAVEALQRGQAFVTSKIWDSSSEGRLNQRNRFGRIDGDRSRLTARELEVVQLLVEGKTSKEVSALLGISVKTTETHRANIMRKLNFHSVSQLVMYAVRNNLLRTSMPQETHN